MRRVKQLIFLGLLSLLIISGCSQRKNPLQMEIDNGGLFESTFEFSSLENVLNDPVGRTLLVYLPPGYQEGIASNYKYPILFLLHGFKENGRSYEQFYNIKTIADQMIASGEIQPMIIIMPDGAGIFGGSFFNNSVYSNGSNFGGKYEDYVTQELFDKILYNYGPMIRGISYKVSQMDSLDIDTVKTTIIDTVCKADTTKHPPCPPPDTSTRIITFIYTSIETTTVTWTDTTATIIDSVLFQQNFGISGHGSGGYGALRIATDYPLAFGSASAMSAPLNFESLLDFIPAFMDSNGVDANGNGYYQIDPDPNTLDRLSCLFFAMAVAFSPHNPSDPTTTYFELLSDIGVNLPFDSLGDPVSVIWQKWLLNDMKTRIINLPSSDTLVKKLKFYIDCGDKDEFGFNEQAVVFYNALLGKVPASNITFETYSGYPGYPALNNSFIYDRLRKVLKFHSDCFTAP
ncbi:MAG: alpha/beta hydrolase-fold protein [Candidatus Zixiibacteriota bacterium]